ncbi:MAG TPA: thioredoxin-like domain-containing protein [Vicinamibacterales bacterium]|nr:thioredoxin-like domain-containing protein [Vicinamibacterales bacterium]
MTIASAPFGGCATAGATGGEPRERAAFARATEWINSAPLTSASLEGKVVVVDFWTYTCINWLRTLPYVRAWAAKYRHGLVVIGVHTPEFTFEHDLDNVRRSVREMRIDYPVAVDNDSAIWRAFDNNYWPALYVLDPRGRVRHHHFGEGGYGGSERVIQRALADASIAESDSGLVHVEPAGVEAPADWEHLKSPENYLGNQRTEGFADRPDANRRRVYAAPKHLALNEWGLAGEWTVGGESIASGAPNARIVYRFHARDLHLVMGPAQRGKPVPFRVSIDGRPPGPAHGIDVDEGGNGTLGAQRLYQLIRQPDPILDRQFEIEFLEAGAEAYSFTFG